MRNERREQNWAKSNSKPGKLCHLSSLPIAANLAWQNPRGFHPAIYNVQSKNYPECILRQHRWNCQNAWKKSGHVKKQRVVKVMEEMTNGNWAKRSAAAASWISKMASEEWAGIKVRGEKKQTPDCTQRVYASDGKMVSTNRIKKKKLDLQFWGGGGVCMRMLEPLSGWSSGSFGTTLCC